MGGLASQKTAYCSNHTRMCQGSEPVKSGMNGTAYIIYIIGRNGSCPLLAVA